MNAFRTRVPRRTSPFLLVFVLGLVMLACAPGTIVPAPTSPPAPTYTPYPTYTPVATSPPPTPEAVTAEVTAQALNVRSGPGIAYPRLGVARESDVFTLDGRNEGGSWVRGQAQEDDLTGWLSASYADVTGNVTELPVIDVDPPPTPEPTSTRPPGTPTPAEPVALTPGPVGERGGNCPGNRLVNGGFEGGFSQRERGEIVVADGWHPWYKTHPGTGGLNYIPEYKPEDAQAFGDRRVHSGRFAQKWFTTFATHTAGILQQVAGIPRGSRLLFTTWVQVWSDDTDDPATSDVPGNYRVAIGIDPFGGTDWNSDNIVWSEFNTFAYDAYKQLSVSTVAQNNVVTVFLKGVPEFPVKHNDSYWDDACLTVEQ